MSKTALDAARTGLHRKPASWDEVGLPIDATLSLPIYQATDLGIDTHIHSDFRWVPSELMFIVERKGGLYLVDTQGCSYVRYVRYIGATNTPNVSGRTCLVCNNKRYLTTTRGDGKPVVERCDTCSQTSLSDEGAALLAQKDGIKCASTYPCYITTSETGD